MARHPPGTCFPASSGATDHLAAGDLTQQETAAHD